MTKASNDPTAEIRLQASQYPDVDKGTACTQTSFKANKKGFLYIGEQGGRYKAMFKLQDSIPQAQQLAEDQPDCFEVGSTNWVTARFTAEKPLPKRLWKKWLNESYALSTQKKAKKAATKKTGSKKPARKKTATTKTKAARKKTPGKTRTPTTSKKEDNA